MHLLGKGLNKGADIFSSMLIRLGGLVAMVCGVLYAAQGLTVWLSEPPFSLSIPYLDSASDLANPGQRHGCRSTSRRTGGRGSLSNPVYPARRGQWDGGNTGLTSSLRQLGALNRVRVGRCLPVVSVLVLRAAYRKRYVSYVRRHRSRSIDH